MRRHAFAEPAPMKAQGRDRQLRRGAVGDFDTLPSPLRYPMAFIH
jgi:hypothetical protein